MAGKDRLLRFGADLIFTLCALFGVRAVMMENEPETFEDRLAQDVIELMTILLRPPVRTPVSSEPECGGDVDDLFRYVIACGYAHGSAGA